ncbi:YheT family hydrolase [Sediminibacterium ginsengisoli]|uniref:AB hydrolase-1 domain-containing protein n=1 Tax=Sediminibacterium ginsengisoli TaxID=413434 RepID=A0A1T4MG81_9BACT|nr:alpha/beta fold hydrolase [Sediminibacterium ginsengisoli]SJZ65867.1 hypothetical protein SAMN04488132_103374 [Sediminibacterium ginsengisoli]
MPVLETPILRPAFLHLNGHLQTIFPLLLRRIDFRYTDRERVELPDGDFLDLDWHRNPEPSDKLVLITHGLEGDSSREYVRGLAKLFVANGYDVLAWNCRSCSGEMNRLPRFYHHGDFADLHFVLKYAIGTYGYKDVVLAGFSMGGSLTLRAVAENTDSLPTEVSSTVSYSVPCDLKACAEALTRKENRVYLKRFLKKLGEKIKAKEKIFPGVISAEGFHNIKNFSDFDNRYTAPLHGFDDADDFYRNASVKPALKKIRVPSLIVQALNDPFLVPACIPYEEAAENPSLYLEVPATGGHCGFMIRNSNYTYAELRALEFAKQFAKV